jgi:chemotaxis methyl-accepting protein methylase
MVAHKIDTIASYAHFLQENLKETTILFKELLIGVTNFFRDPLVWKKLKEEILPTLIAKTRSRVNDPGMDPGMFNWRRGLFIGNCF